MLFAAQAIQSAADFAARELARTPLPATATLREALQDSAARQIYDEHFLVINLDDLPEGLSIMDYVATLPPVNQQLFPLMVLTHVNGVRLLRYPGALVTDGNPDDDPPNAHHLSLLVKVPVLLADGTLQWHDVIEGIREGLPANEDPFSIAASERGLVALRIHYPFQAASLSGFRPATDEQGQPDYFRGNVNQVIEADDSEVADPGLPDGSTVVTPEPLPGSDYGGTYGGAYGLGEQGAFAKTVRPYRKVIMANGIARREIFGAP